MGKITYEFGTLSDNIPRDKINGVVDEIENIVSERGGLDF